MKGLMFSLHRNHFTAMLIQFYDCAEALICGTIFFSEVFLMFFFTPHSTIKQHHKSDSLRGIRDLTSDISSQMIRDRSFARISSNTIQTSMQKSTSTQPSALNSNEHTHRGISANTATTQTIGFYC